MTETIIPKMNLRVIIDKDTIKVKAAMLRVDKEV